MQICYTYTTNQLFSIDTRISSLLKSRTILFSAVRQEQEQRSFVWAEGRHTENGGVKRATADRVAQGEV